MKNFKTIVSLILISIMLNSCEKDDPTKDDSAIEGTWVRLPGPSGDRTDLAIGGITGEPSNRVYMCEKRGSTAAGFYKGTYSNKAIVWDAVYGLPNFSVNIVDNELELDCNVCLPTKYQKGAWSGECGPIVYATKNIAVGLINNDLTGITVKGLTIDNIITPLQLISGSVTSPDCSSGNSFISVNDDILQHQVITKWSLNGGVDKESYIMIDKSVLTDGCNKFKFRYDPRIQMLYIVKF